MTSNDAKRPRRRRFPFFRLISAFLVGLLLAGALGVGALYAYDSRYATRVLPGVSVGAVDLSGLDREAARARLAQAYASFSEGRVVVRLGDEETVIGFGDLGRRADIDAMLEQGRIETDPAARRELYLELCQILADMAVAAPLVDEYSVWAGASNVQGLQFNGYTYPIFGDIWLAEG